MTSTTETTHTHHCADCGEQVDDAGCPDHPEAGIDSVRAAETEAERVATLLHGDGQCYSAEDGTRFDALMKREGATIGYQHEGTIRWEFSDGSAIVDCDGGGWDIGRPGHDSACTCWPEATGERCVCGTEPEATE